MLIQYSEPSVPCIETQGTRIHGDWSRVSRTQQRVYRACYAPSRCAAAGLGVRQRAVRLDILRACRVCGRCVQQSKSNVRGVCAYICMSQRHTTFVPTSATQRNARPARRTGARARVRVFSYNLWMLLVRFFQSPHCAPRAQPQ